MVGQWAVRNRSSCFSVGYADSSASWRQEFLPLACDNVVWDRVKILVIPKAALPTDPITLLQRETGWAWCDLLFAKLCQLLCISLFLLNSWVLPAVFRGGGRDGWYIASYLPLLSSFLNWDLVCPFPETRETVTNLHEFPKVIAKGSEVAPAGCSSARDNFREVWTFSASWYCYLHIRVLTIW